ncbi:MAG TPA: hypothetical protein VM510_02935, partial [Caulifigura sp.]|nr:hypothetical protein [Caulifigura sp.]
LAVEGPDSKASTSHVATRTPIREDLDTPASVGIAPQALTSVAEVFANDPSARIDLRDLPDSPLAQLGDEKLLQDVSPALTQGGKYELRSVLSLPEPFRLDFPPEKARSPQELHLRLSAPRALLEVSRRPRDRSAGWEKCIDCRLSVSQDLAVRLTGASSEGRLVDMEWNPQPQIEGDAQFVHGFTGSNGELHSQRLVDAFRSAWRQWTTDARETSKVDDLAVGGARLRLNAVPVRGGRVWLEFEPGSSAVKW